MRIFFLLFGVALTAATPIRAQPPSTDCFAETTVPPERRIAACDMLIETKSKFVLAHVYFMRAEARAALHGDSLAIADLTCVLTLLPDNLPALVNRAIAYGRLYDYKHALADDDRVIQLQPGLVVGYINRGVVLADKGENARAIADFDHALNMDPRLSAGILSNRGRSYVQLRDFSHAVADENASIKLNANNAEAYSNRCYARAAANLELNRAMADCNHSLSLKPGDLNALEKRGLVFLRERKFGEARRDFDAALLIEPKRAFCLYGRGLARGGLEDAAGSKVDFEDATASDPKIEMQFAAMGLT